MNAVRAILAAALASGLSAPGAVAVPPGVDVVVEHGVRLK